MTIAQDCLEAGISYSTYKIRRRKGDSHEDALRPAIHCRRMNSPEVIKAHLKNEDTERVRKAKGELMSVLTLSPMSSLEIRRAIPNHNTSTINCALSVLVREGIAVKSRDCNRTYYALKGVR